MSATVNHLTHLLKICQERCDKDVISNRKRRQNDDGDSFDDDCFDSANDAGRAAIES